MGAVEGGPNVVNSGLVLCLDAANNKSYPGSGTTWTDLSPNQNNGILTNGPTFNTGSGGGIAFDGTNDYVNCTFKPSINNIFTINSWVKFSELGYIGGYIKRKTVLSYDYPYSPNIGFLFVGSGNNGSDFFISLGQDQKVATSTTGYIILNQIAMLTAVCNAANDLIRLYKNGIEVSYSFQTNADVNLTYSNTPYLGARNVTSYYDMMNGHIYNLQLYNRALSASEVFQNYNATKGRFGL